MGGCLARPAETRRVDVVRPARSEDARGKDEDRPSRPFSSRLRLSPLDSALCIRGLVVYWAFGFDRRLDPDAVRASLAAALVKFPALAGRARVRARRGATVELEVDLEHPHAGVAFEVRDDPATTLEDLQRAGPPSARDNVTPSTLFRPLHIRCCEKEGLLCAVRLTRLGGDAAPATVLGVSWSHALADGCAMRAFCEAWTSEALAQSAAGSPPRRPLRDPSHDRLEVLAGVEPRDARAFPALRLEENQSALALARGRVRRPGRRGVRAARAGHRAPPRGGREGAQGVPRRDIHERRRPRGHLDAVPPAQKGGRPPRAEAPTRSRSGERDGERASARQLPGRRRARLATEPVRERLAHGLRAARGDAA